MSIKDFYSAVNGNYDEVFAQLGDDGLIVEFIRKFLAKNEIENLKTLLNEKKFHDAFICVHNIKGYGLNMALPILHKSACNLCETLRNGAPTVNIEPLVIDLDSAVKKIVEAEKLI